MPRALLLLLVLSAPSALAQPVSLHQRYQSGTRYVFTMENTMTQRMQIEMPGRTGEQPVDQSTLMTHLFVSTLSVEADGDTAVVLTQTLQRVRFDRRSQGLAETVDTDDEATVLSSSMGRMFKAMLGVPMRRRVAHTGRVTPLTDPDSLLVRTTAAMPVPPEARAQALQQIRAFTSSMNSAAPQGLPDHDLVPGEAWTFTLDSPAPVPMRTTMTSRLERVENGRAYVSMTGTTEPVGGAPVAGDGSIPTPRISSQMTGRWEQQLDDAASRSEMIHEMEITNTGATPPSGRPSVRTRSYMRMQSRSELRRAE